QINSEPTEFPIPCANYARELALRGGTDLSPPIRAIPKGEAAHETQSYFTCHFCGSGASSIRAARACAIVYRGAKFRPRSICGVAHLSVYDGLSERRRLPLWLAYSIWLDALRHDIGRWHQRRRHDLPDWNQRIGLQSAAFLCV